MHVSRFQEKLKSINHNAKFRGNTETFLNSNKTGLLFTKAENLKTQLKIQVIRPVDPLG